MKNNDAIELYFSPVRLSPPDDRDYRVGASLDVPTEFPKTYAVWQPPVEDQGQVGNCVAQAIANVFECWEHKLRDVHKDYSVGYIYGTSEDYGMTPRKACSAMVKEGDVLRETWECLAENPECWEERQAVSDYIKNSAVKIKEYVRLYSLEEIKAFIMQYELPVVIIAKGADYSWMATGGYHATACFGWTANDELRYTNSWGTGGAFGDGTGEISYNKIIECWGLIMDDEARGFKDVPKGYWAEDYILKMQERGIINGLPGRIFEPNSPITRAQSAAISARIIADQDLRIAALEKKIADLENLIRLLG